MYILTAKNEAGECIEASDENLEVAFQSLGSIKNSKRWSITIEKRISPDDLMNELERLTGRELSEILEKIYYSNADTFDKFALAWSCAKTKISNSY